MTSALTTLPPLFVRHPPLHREGKKGYFFRLSSFGTSLKEGGRENCRKTLDGTRPGVLKYPQSNEQSRCGGKSTVFRPAREAPPGLEGRSGRAGNVRLPRLRPGAMSAASSRYRENEEEGNFLDIKWNRASLRLYTMYRGRRILFRRKSFPSENLRGEG